MSSFRMTLAAGMLLGGLVAGTAQAAPAMPQTGLSHDMTETVAMRRRHMHGHRTTRAERRARRMNTMQHGNPNARNPERPGYKQQLGNTTNGPRY